MIQNVTTVTKAKNGGKMNINNVNSLRGELRGQQNFCHLALVFMPEEIT